MTTAEAAELAMLMQEVARLERENQQLRDAMKAFEIEKAEEDENG